MNICKPVTVKDFFLKRMVHLEKKPSNNCFGFAIKQNRGKQMVRQWLKNLQNPVMMKIHEPAIPTFELSLPSLLSFHLLLIYQYMTCK